MVCLKKYEQITRRVFYVPDAGHVPHTLRIPQRCHFWRSSIFLLDVVIVSWCCTIPVQYNASAECRTGERCVLARLQINIWA